MPLINIGKLPTFSDVISIMKNHRISRMENAVLVPLLRKLILDNASSGTDFIASQFDVSNPYAFLANPLKNPDAKRRDYVLFRTPSAQSCILNILALDKANLFSFFSQVDAFITRNELEYLNDLVSYYDKSFALVAKADIAKSERLTEQEKDSLTGFFDLYIGFLNSKSNDMNAKLLLLFSLINGEVIHLLEAIKSMIKFSEERAQFQTKTKFVLQSAMGSNLFIGADETHEPMNGEDTQRIKRTILYSLSRNMLNLNNAIFEFEEATEAENREDDSITDYGPRTLPVLGEGFTLAKGMNMLMSIGGTIYEHCVKGSMFKKKKYYIKMGDKYLYYKDWHTESRLLLGKKNKRARWFIHQNNDKSITITPSGGLQYYGFCIDIPNATQQTFHIPMWLFFKNGTNAQKFFLHEILE